MKACNCGSYAINHHLYGRDGSDTDKCDVCFWRSRADRYRKALERLRDCDWTITLPDRMDAVRAIAREALEE